MRSIFWGLVGGYKTTLKRTDSFSLVLFLREIQKNMLREVLWQIRKEYAGLGSKPVILLTLNLQ